MRIDLPGFVKQLEFFHIGGEVFCPLSTSRMPRASLVMDRDFLVFWVKCSANVANSPRRASPGVCPDFGETVRLPPRKTTWAFLIPSRMLFENLAAQFLQVVRFPIRREPQRVLGFMRVALPAINDRSHGEIPLQFFVEAGNTVTENEQGLLLVGAEALIFDVGDFGPASTSRGEWMRMSTKPFFVTTVPSRSIRAWNCDPLQGDGFKAQNLRRSEFLGESRL